MMAQHKSMRQIRLHAALRVLNTETQAQAEERKRAKRTAKIERIHRRAMWLRKHKNEIIENVGIITIIALACLATNYLSVNYG